MVIIFVCYPNFKQKLAYWATNSALRKVCDTTALIVTSWVHSAVMS